MAHRRKERTNKFQSEVIIAGYYNIDLLKINDKSIISEYLFSHFTFSPQLPTILSNYQGTLIVNFLRKLSKGLFKSSAGILINTISDNFPYFISLDYVQTVNDVPRFMLIKQQSWRQIRVQHARHHAPSSFVQH